MKVSLDDPDLLLDELLSVVDDEREIVFADLLDELRRSHQIYQYVMRPHFSAVSVGYLSRSSSALARAIASHSFMIGSAFGMFETQMLSDGILKTFDID